MSSGGYPGTWERGSLTSDIDVRYENFASKVPSWAPSLTWFPIQETKENYMVD